MRYPQEIQVAKITIPGTNPEPSDSNILPCLLCTPPLFNAQSHPKLRSRARQTQKSSSHVPPKRRTAEQVRERQFGSAWQASSRGRRRDDEQQLPSAAGLASRRGTNSPLPLDLGIGLSVSVSDASLGIPCAARCLIWLLELSGVPVTSFP
jgi:hypothetical protein